MDSVTQLVLGSAVGIAVMGRRTTVWKAALWGGVCGTIPDLDVVIDHGDAISDMTLHRAQSHSLFWLSLISPLIGWLAAWIHRGEASFRRWWLAVWLALVTHPLLDWMTIYGTQLALPFSNYPFGLGSIFVIDPIYTLALTVGVVAALAGSRGDSGRGRRWNFAGLALSSGYLAWSVVAQQHVTDVARAALHEQGISTERLLVVPTPFNTLLWRLVAIEGETYLEGFYGLLDRDRLITFERFARGEDLYRQWRDNWYVARIAWFSHGFFSMRRDNDRLLISDLRMGQEPSYTFTFAIAPRAAGTGSSGAPATRSPSPTAEALAPAAPPAATSEPPSAASAASAAAPTPEPAAAPTPEPAAASTPKPTLVPPRTNLRIGLGWLWRRIWGERLPSPRALTQARAQAHSRAPAQAQFGAQADAPARAAVGVGPGSAARLPPGRDGTTCQKSSGLLSLAS